MDKVKEIPTWTHQRHLIDAYERAEAVGGQGVIVELGSWLGATTERLGAGAPEGTPIHSYDYFIALPHMATKYSWLTAGQDYEQDFLRNVSKYNVTSHKGDLADATWEGTPIELYVDDGAKTPWLFIPCLKTFGPSFIPGITVLILMDLLHYKLLKDPKWFFHRYQSRFMDSHKANFQLLETDPATYLYLGGLNFEKLSIPWYAKGWIKKAIRAVSVTRPWKEN